MKKLWIGVCLCCGCSVGPKYKAPETVLETDFANAAPVEQVPFDHQIGLARWWEQFQDPILTGLVQQALCQNLDLVQAYQRIEQVRAYYKLQESELFPRVDGTVLYDRYRSSQNQYDSPFLGPPIQSLFQLGFDASWEIDLFGRLRNLTAAAKADLGAAREEYHALYLTLVADVCRNYVLYRSNQKQWENVVEQIQVATEEAALQKSLATAGLNPWQPFFAFSSQVRTLQAELAPLEIAKQKALYRIAVLIGQQPEQIKIEGPAEIFVAKGLIPVGLPSDLLRRRPDIRENERKLAAATHRVAASIAEYFPTFSLFGNYGWSASRSYKWFRPESTYWSFNPSLSVPIINFGEIRSHVEINTAEKEMVFAAYQQSILQALEEVENGLYSYTKEQVRLTQVEFSLLNLNEVYRLEQASFNAGLLPFGDVLAQKQRVLQSEREKIQVSQGVAESLIALYKSLGGEWECSNTP